MEKLTKTQEIIKLLFKDFSAHYNSRSISKVIHISHAGAFKILKKLEERGIVNGQRIGNAVIYSLNKENPVVLKEIELILTIEAQNYLRWSEEFKEIKDKSKFIVLFGSIVREEKSAKDIDLLIVADKIEFSKIKKLIEERQKFLNKRVHPIIQTPEDFEKDLKNKNRITIEIIKTGIILYGQEEFRKRLK